MLYLLQQMFIDLNLMEKFHIEVLNLCNKTFVPLVIVNDIVWIEVAESEW